MTTNTTHLHSAAHSMNTTHQQFQGVVTSNIVIILGRHISQMPGFLCN